MYRQPTQTSDCNLGDIGQKIVWGTAWVLTNEAAFMSTDGVEVSEHRDGPTRIGASQVIEHVLGSQFCPAIGLATPPTFELSDIGKVPGI